MATIIKGGKNEFVGHCKWCGCDFRYTADEVLGAVNQVACPFCKKLLDHHGEHGTSTCSPTQGPHWVAYAQNQAAVKG